MFKIATRKVCGREWGVFIVRGPIIQDGRERKCHVNHTLCRLEVSHTVPVQQQKAVIDRAAIRARQTVSSGIAPVRLRHVPLIQVG